MSGIEGVALGRVERIISGGWAYSHDFGPDHRSYEPGRWHPEPVHIALQAVAEAARWMRSDRLPGAISVNEGVLFAALDALAEAQAS